MKGNTTEATQTAPVLWHNTAEGDRPQIPEEQKNVIYPHIPCLVEYPDNMGYSVLQYNPIEKCWDTEDCDGYAEDFDTIVRWAYVTDIAKLR